ncbi:M1 family metallopeptidase [Leadbetterella sp. DM7]|uniref:M1 family metallopeptidase n=1 Tax=Leadbetterella sp. DM7 TaxID=3235085 RepID=UPI00349EE323
MKKLVIVLSFLAGSVCAQNIRNNPTSNHGNKFEQLGTIMSDPNMYRSASGAPGPNYWQQKADYVINVELDDSNQKITGSETITYTNNSPDPLSYLWLQLDENQHASNAESKSFDGSRITARVSENQIRSMTQKPTKEFGVNIMKVTDATGKALPYTINYTMMRIDLPAPLRPGTKFVFKVDWNYNISDRMKEGGRGGYEYFAKDDNYLYTITQWFPRMAVYSDFQGWQHKQFTGRGEFALAFGDYKVNITVPADHVVGATGVCLNYDKVLSADQLKRWKAAQNETREPVEVVTKAEMESAIRSKATTKKTWTYEAKNVRDFAFVSSRRLVWDAMKTDGIEGNTPMAMSYYGPEAYGLYRKYSTKVVAHTLRNYSKHTISYPYPVAISVEAANGMEYPMICFNYGRTEEDGTYSEATKYGMIGVIIHEVGHNFFPMIVNSDERQWTWMDEGLNTFVQYLTEQAWEPGYPSKRGPAFMITDYMKLPKDQLEPIMTNSENIVQFGPNAYAKPATGLNILRETIMGRELFDFAFKEYATRWAFKHPTPADFFRTMEDASAVDLDWFWRGWFYDIEPVDISIEDVKHYMLNDKDPERVAKEKSAAFDRDLDDISRKRNKEEGLKYAVEADTSLLDFYNKWDRFAVSEKEKADFARSKSNEQQYHFYEINFKNIGGLVMPLIIEWEYTDGTKEVERISAYIWRKNENEVTKVFAKAKEVKAVKLDPYRETADIDEDNNVWPRNTSKVSRFEAFRMSGVPRGASTGGNPMQQAKAAQK